MEIDVAQYLLSRGVPVVPVSRARPRVLHVAEYPEPFAPQCWPTCWPRNGLRWPMASIACERRRKKPSGLIEACAELIANAPVAARRRHQPRTARDRWRDHLARVSARTASQTVNHSHWT
jgi:hypothetical protein